MNNASILPKAVFFDMDGVLYDSMWQHAEAWVRAFETIGIHFPPEKAYLNEGRTGRGTIEAVYLAEKKRPASHEEVEQIYSFKTEIMQTFPPALPIKGMLELLTKLHNNGIEIWVVTGSSRLEFIDKLVKDFPGLIHPDRKVTGRDVLRGKPHPEPYLKALERSGYSAAEVAVVENAPMGIQSAQAAGIHTVAINTGILQDKILWESGANIVLSGGCELNEKWHVLSRN